MPFTGEVKSDFLKSVVMPKSKRPNFINFAGTDFIELRQGLIDYIKAVYPLDYENFQESDLGVMLIEIVAYMGAVLSHKADALANENYLKTARQRSNVQKLLELIGVRMRGPISAATNARIIWPWTSAGASPWQPGDLDVAISITPANRVITVTSPEDGELVTYTLYKVKSDGMVDTANSTGNVSLVGTESHGGVSSVHTNVALLEGSLVVQEGTFASTEDTKTVTLEQAPVVEGSADVFITGQGGTSGAYSEVDNIYFASGSSDKIFQLLTDDDFNATVVFGDNFISQSPNVGDNYIITYRIGGGSRGNIRSNAINTSITGAIGATEYVGEITNTSVGVGGADAETVDHAKRYAPQTFRRQDRIVTLPDFEAFANTFISKHGSVGKATASVRKAFSSANVIDIYVLEKANDLQLRRATPQFKSELLTAMNRKKMLTDELVVVDGLIRALDLVVTVRIDKELERMEPEIQTVVRDNILKYFFVDNIEFGQALYLQDLARSIHNVEAVRFATVDNISDDIMVEHNEIIQLNNLTINMISI